MVMYVGPNQHIPEVTAAPALHSPVAREVSQALLKHVGAIAKACAADAIFVFEEALGGQGLELPAGLPTRIIHVAREAVDVEQGKCPANPQGPWRLCVPGVPLSRVGQVKIAVFLALTRDMVKPGEVIVFLCGDSGAGLVDTIIVTQVGRELETLRLRHPHTPLPNSISPQVLDRVLDIASELGSEGREGKPVGTLFVIGDSERVLSLSRPLILNPFAGHPEHQRNILDPRLEETVKEYSTLDGCFIVRGDGVILSAGAMLMAPRADHHPLPLGLGARHHAAAAITAAASDCVAVVISQSTGTVTIFRGGRIVAEIDKPRSHPRPRWVV